jgi:hypothetical protein
MQIIEVNIFNIYGMMNYKKNNLQNVYQEASDSDRSNEINE